MSQLTARIPAARVASATALQVVPLSGAAGTSVVTDHRPGTSMTTAAHTREATSAQADQPVAPNPGGGHPTAQECQTGHWGQAGCRCACRSAATGTKAMVRSSGQATAEGRPANMARAMVTNRR